MSAADELRELIEKAKPYEQGDDFDKRYHHLNTYLNENAKHFATLIEAAERVTYHHGSAQRAVTQCKLLDALKPFTKEPK